MCKLVGTCWIVNLLARTTNQAKIRGAEAYPTLRACITQVDLRSVVGKVSKDDAEIDKARKDTCAETPDRRRRDFSQIQWRDHRRLSDAQAGDETACIDGAQAAIVAQEDGNAQDPKEAKLARCPDTADTIADEECTEKTLILAIACSCLSYLSYMTLTRELPPQIQSGPWQRRWP